MRIRLALALMVAGLLLAAGVASAQTSTDPTSGYTVTTTATGTYTTTTPTTTTTEQQSTTQHGSSAPATAGVTQGGGSAPAAAAATTQQAPSQLAFTGAEPLLLIVLGLIGAGAATTLLVRDRRRAMQRR